MRCAGALFMALNFSFFVRGSNRFGFRRYARAGRHFLGAVFRRHGLFTGRPPLYISVVSERVVFAFSPPFPLKSRHSRHILYSCGFPAVLKSTQNHSCGGCNSPGAPLFMRLWRLWRLFGDIWGGDSERRRLQTMSICSLSECCHPFLESFGGGRS
jgi:hypothetical protein